MWHDSWDDHWFTRDAIATSFINGEIKQELFKTDSPSKRSEMKELHKNITSFLKRLVADKEAISILNKTLKPLTQAFEKNCLEKLPTNPNLWDED